MMRVFFQAIPIRSFASTTSALKWEGGVSMVQGASRGIGFAFVRDHFHFLFSLSCSCSSLLSLSDNVFSLSAC